MPVPTPIWAGLHTGSWHSGAAPAPSEPRLPLPAPGHCPVLRPSTPPPTRVAIDDPATPADRAPGRPPLPAPLAHRPLQHGLALAGAAGCRHLRRRNDGIARIGGAARHPAHVAARRVRLHRRHLRRPPVPAHPALQLARARGAGLARRPRPRALGHRRLLAHRARDLPLRPRLDHGHAGPAADDRRRRRPGADRRRHEPRQCHEQRDAAHRPAVRRAALPVARPRRRLRPGGGALCDLPDPDAGASQGLRFRSRPELREAPGRSARGASASSPASPSFAVFSMSR